jgi:signal transduction histidine kinase
MKLQKKFLLSVIGMTLPVLITLIMLFYTYAKFFGHPYGFRWGSSTGTIIYVFDKQPEPTLREGDQIIQIGNITWEEFDSDLRKIFFDGARPGDVVPIIVERNGQVMNVNWIYPNFNRDEILDQLISEWFIAYFFWLAGIITIVLIRPRDGRWLLMSAFCFLTAIWLLVGSGVSAFHVGYGALILRMVIWLCVPVYMHLHWVFPRPLRKLPVSLVWIGYGIAVVLAVAQGFQLVPKDLYLFGFLIAIGGSLILIFIHWWRQPSVRRDLRLLIVVALLAMGLPLIWQLIYVFVGLPPLFGGFGLLSFPLLPFAYLYAAYRRQLGMLELRLNRFISSYLFLILLGIIALPLIALEEYMPGYPGKTLVVGSVVAIMIAVICIWGYPVFQNFIESRILGIRLSSKRLLEIYSNLITTSNTLPDLVRVIDEEIIPSLLIRQFVFLQVENGSSKVLSKTGVNDEQIPKVQDVPDLMTQTDVYLSPDPLSKDRPYSWIRLILPLKLGEETIGFWLFGRRDPDDMYSQLEIPIIKSLANQTAVALSNILQTEHLRAMYEANIDRNEQERLRLSRDLHDGILNQIATLLMSTDDASVFSPEFQKGFEVLTERLREIVSDLRSPMLDLGLKFAFEDIADKLAERNQDTVRIMADIQADSECRYPEKVESHLYRIVQEACENSLKHSRAKTMKITVRLFPEKTELQVEDDGIGFDGGANLKLDDMLVGKHFGLAGMHERASLIGAEVYIYSKPGMGTRVQVIWESK